jgi:co-chaperonin GroES (HSP10)
LEKLKTMNRKFYRITVKRISTDKNKTRIIALSEDKAEATAKRLNIKEGDYMLVYFEEFKD